MCCEKGVCSGRFRHPNVHPHGRRAGLSRSLYYYHCAIHGGQPGRHDQQDSRAESVEGIGSTGGRRKCNRAGGTTGITRAAKAAPDGYTIVIASTGTHAGAAALYPNLGYDPADSFESIGFIGSTPVTVVARKDFPPNTLQELIAHLRSNQKTVTLAHAGIGSISHIFCTYLQRLVGVRTLGVPFRGLSDSTQALLAGQVDYSCNQAPLTVEYVSAGTLKAYAITSEARSAMMPLLPTAAE